jgi:serine/threonine protein kinase
LQLASVLAFVHSNKIIHGDIGIHNLLVDADGNIVLCDFGGSKIDSGPCLAFPSARYRRLAQTSETKIYYSPVIQDDIFALGMIIYEIHSEKQLWSELSHPEVLEKIGSRSWPDLSVVDKEKDRLVIKNCWTNAYSSVDELFKELS